MVGVALFDPDRPRVEGVDVAALRADYVHPGIDVGDVDPDPLTAVRRWIEDAVRAGQPEPNAMTLATVDADGRPDARVVLARGVDERGVSFFTSYRSAKARQLVARPDAALVFVWLPLARQIRLTGVVEALDAAESDAYFASRPLESRIGAWASEQSEVIPDRAALERRVDELRTRFAGGDVPRPAHWGGYLLRPTAVELWQGRPHRLHDRIRYRRPMDGETPGPAGWVLERLSP